MADDALRHAKDGHSLANAIVDTVREALIVLDRDLRVVAASRSFYQTFGGNPQDTQGQLFYDLDNGQWNIPALRRLLEEVVPQHRTIEGYEVEHEFPIIGRRAMLLNARQVFEEEHPDSTQLLLAIEDITQRRDAEREKDDLLRQKEMLLVATRPYRRIIDDRPRSRSIWQRASAEACRKQAAPTQSRSKADAAGADAARQADRRSRSYRLPRGGRSASSLRTSRRMTSEVNEPTRRLRREGSLNFSTVLLTRNGAQNFHSFRSSRRRPRCTDRPMNKFAIICRPIPTPDAKCIFELGQHCLQNVSGIEGGSVRNL